ncbi:MAG TPA: hypothetical protein VI933_04600 [archaeon]|nr:hypothetical protein [archaeon]
MTAIEDAVSSFAGSLTQQIPVILTQIIAATITVLLGLVIGKVIGRVAREIVIRSRIDEWISSEDHVKFRISSILDLVVRWTIYFVFLKQAAIFLGVAAITEFINNMINVIPSLLEGSLIIIIGYAIAVYLKDKIISSKTVYSDLTGKIIFFFVVYISIALALPFVGINPTLINNILLVIAGSVGLGLAIALGWGLKDVVRDVAHQYVKKFIRSRKR